MQQGILNGIYVDAAPDMRSNYPRNYVPVAKENGVSAGYLKPGDGITQWGSGPGPGRGGINWNGKVYRVMGTQLCEVSASGSVVPLGEVGGAGQVTMDYSFDRLGIASGGSLYYFDGTGMTEVGGLAVIDFKWIAGYFVTTDGADLRVTELTDPTRINPIKFATAESDPDKIQAVDELRNELYVLGRYTIEVMENVGGDFFPFAPVKSAMVPKGAIGTHAYCSIGDTFAFLGSGRGEAPAVYLMLPGDTQKLSTREIDRILQDYTEQELSEAVMETRVDRNSQFVYLHLPDRTLVYDTIGSKLLGESVWFTLDSGKMAPAAYRARNFVWCYGEWSCEDPTSNSLGLLTDAVSTHYGAAVGWEFGTPMAYNAGNDAIVLELELVALPGRVPLGAEPKVWTSHTTDGELWSQERAAVAGKQGERARRVAWRNCGRICNYRMQKFRGSSDAHLPVIRLEAKFEPLSTRPGRG